MSHKLDWIETSKSLPPPNTLVAAKTEDSGNEYGCGLVYLYSKGNNYVWNSANTGKELSIPPTHWAFTTTNNCSNSAYLYTNLAELLTFLMLMKQQLCDESSAKLAVPPEQRGLDWVRDCDSILAKQELITMILENKRHGSNKGHG